MRPGGLLLLLRLLLLVPRHLLLLRPLLLPLLLGLLLLLLLGARSRGLVSCCSGLGSLGRCHTLLLLPPAERLG